MRRTAPVAGNASPGALDILPGTAPKRAAERPAELTDAGSMASAPAMSEPFAAQPTPAFATSQPAVEALAPHVPTFAAAGPASFAVVPDAYAPAPSQPPALAATPPATAPGQHRHAAHIDIAGPLTPKQGWPTWVKVAIGLVVGFIGVAILAAVAIPVFLNDRKPPAVTLVLPRSLEGSAQLTSPNALQAAAVLRSTVSDQAALLDTQAAVYGRGDTLAFGVFTAKLAHVQSTSAMTKFLASANTNNASTPLAAVAPGALGGKTECGLETSDGVQLVLCLSIDKSAVVGVVVDTGDLTDDVALAQKLRLAVERH